MAIPLRKRFRRAARSLLIRAALRIVGLLPLRPALRLGGALGVLGYLLAGKSRRLALAHLALAFPDIPEPDRRRIARRSFIHLGQSAMEVATIRHHDRELESYVGFAGDGERLLREAIGRGRGLVFVTGHVGNWELLARRIARAGIENAVIAKTGWDPKLNALAERFRAEGGVATLWREDPATGRAIIRTFREGKALGILIDQDTRVQGVFVPFFGRPAYTPRAAGDLALRFGAPVVVCTCRRRGPRPGDGHLLDLASVTYDPSPADQEAEAVRITAACTALLEAAIRRSPAEWVWMHERWKTPPAAEAAARSTPKTPELSSG
jgi:KDO2-lipid IV(A) lauroyltransferase